MPDTESRIRTGLHSYASTMTVHRPPLHEVLASGDAPRPRVPVRSLLAVAAVVAALVGAVVLLKGPEEQVMVDAPDVPVVWPLGGDVPADVLRTPASAAAAYVHTGLGLPPEWQNSRDSSREGRSANEQFALRDSDVSLRVWLVEVDGRWFVTSASFDDGPQIGEARVVGGAVRLKVVVPDDQGLPRDGWVAELSDTEGAVLTTTTVELEGDVWQADVDVPAGREPAAVTVRLDAEVPVSASAIVLPAGVADHPVKSLFPAANTSYYDAWTYTLSHPDDAVADWEEAVTRAIGAVSNGTPVTSTFDQVVERPDGFGISGRFRTSDGGAGTFELARLQLDGPWFVISVKDDAFEVRDVAITANGVEVMLVLREDYTLATGHVLEPVETFGQGGEEGTFAREFDTATGVAGTWLVYEAVDDGSLLRFYDAWGPPE